jgi:hypothetical protein
MAESLIQQNQIRDLPQALVNLANDIDNKIAAQALVDASTYDTITEVNRKIGEIPNYIQGAGITISDLDENGNRTISIDDIELFKIVDDLPSEGIPNKIYMVAPSGNTDEENLFVEWVWIVNKDFDPSKAIDDDNPKGRWESVGQLTLSLDAYATKDYADNAADVAQSNAESTAALDATTKANAKTITAIKVMSGDATPVDTEIVTLQQNNIDIANAVSLATQAYVDLAKAAAAVDATTKANAAKADAISTADADATAKSNAKDITAIINDGIVTLRKGTTTPTSITNADSLASTDYADKVAEDAADSMGTLKDITAAISSNIVTLKKNNTVLENADNLATKAYADGVITAAIDSDDIIVLKSAGTNITNATSIASTAYADAVAAAAQAAAIAADPTTLPNPHKLILGDKEYDGSEEVDVPLSAQVTIDVSGQITGLNSTFTLTTAEVANENVYLNGVRLLRSVDYTINGTILEIIRTEKPKTVDKLYLTYFTGRTTADFASIAQGYRADTAIQPNQLNALLDAYFDEGSWD